MPLHQAAKKKGGAQRSKVPPFFYAFSFALSLAAHAHATLVARSQTTDDRPQPFLRQVPTKQLQWSTGGGRKEGTRKEGGREIKSERRCYPLRSLGRCPPFFYALYCSQMLQHAAWARYATSPAMRMTSFRLPLLLLASSSSSSARWSSGRYHAHHHHHHHHGGGEDSCAVAGSHDEEAGQEGAGTAAASAHRPDGTTTVTEVGEGAKYPVRVRSNAARDNAAAASRSVIPTPRTAVPLEHRFALAKDALSGRVVDANETGIAKAVPTDITLIRKRTAVRIRWKVPSCATGRQMTPPMSTNNAPHDPPLGATADDGLSPSKSLEGVVAVVEGDTATVTDIFVTSTLSAELLRSHAPSTDVTGVRGIVIYGKRGVTIRDLYVVGNYAVRIQFSDGHDAGIFPYGYLWELCGAGVGGDKFAIMRKYITDLRRARKDRPPPIKATRRSPSS